MSYKELLKDGRWQIRKSEIMRRDDYSCRICGAKASDGATLNVHHLHYRRLAAPWEYGDDELITLCESCHKNEHNLDWKESFDLKVGDFVRYEHSDYENFGVVYFLDKARCMGKIATIDDGSDYTVLWLETIRLKNDGRIISSNGHDVYKDRESQIEDSAESVCGYMFCCLADCLFHVNEYYGKGDTRHLTLLTDGLRKEGELWLLNAKMPEIIKNNKEIAYYLISHDYRVLY